MKTLDDHNREITRTGIACNKCGSELHYTGERHLMYPDFRGVTCLSCGAHGYEHPHWPLSARTVLQKTNSIVDQVVPEKQHGSSIEFAATGVALFLIVLMFWMYFVLETSQ